MGTGSEVKTAGWNIIHSGQQGRRSADYGLGLSRLAKLAGLPGLSGLAGLVELAELEASARGVGSYKPRDKLQH